MPFISDNQIAKLQTWTERMKATQAKVKAKAELAATKAMRIAEIAGTASLAAYTRGQLEGRGQKFELFNMSPELLAGLGLIGASFFEAFGKYDDDMLNVGIGSLTAYAVLVMREQGAKAGAARQILPKFSGVPELTGFSGMPELSGVNNIGSAVTENELLNALRSV